MVRGGDAIDLIGQILNINALESAKHINYILGIGIDFDTPVNSKTIQKYHAEKSKTEVFNEWEKQSYIKIRDRLKFLKALLAKWKINDINNSLNWQYVEEIAELERLINIYTKKEDIQLAEQYIRKVMNKWKI